MFNTYRNDMKYLLIPFLLFLVACEQSNTPSPLQTDVINIEMGGVYKDWSYDTEYQTEIGDAYIHTGWDGDEPTWEIMQGCQYKDPNRNDFSAYIYAIGVTDKYYYFGNIKTKILRNPENNQVDNGYIYTLSQDDEGNDIWEIAKANNSKYLYQPTDKVLYRLNGFKILSSYTW